LHIFVCMYNISTLTVPLLFLKTPSNISSLAMRTAILAGDSSILASSSSHSRRLRVSRHLALATAESTASIVWSRCLTVAVRRLVSVGQLANFRICFNRSGYLTSRDLGTSKKRHF